MTILFYLKPNNYSFPPSGIPLESMAKKKRELKAQRKILDELRKIKRRQKREEEELLLFLEVYDRED